MLCICMREDERERLPLYLRVGRRCENVFLCLQPHTPAFFPLCGSVRACVCYCDILNLSLSSARSSAAGALGLLIFLPGLSLCGHSYGDPDWQSLLSPSQRTCLIGPEQIWGRFEMNDEEACQRVGFIDETKVYFGVIHGHTKRKV